MGRGLCFAVALLGGIGVVGGVERRRPRRLSAQDDSEGVPPSSALQAHAVPCEDGVCLHQAHREHVVNRSERHRAQKL